MKYLSGLGSGLGRQSHPTRGAWIEIIDTSTAYIYNLCRTPHGVRGLKFQVSIPDRWWKRVAPHTGCVD